jgi:hypothetical protein
MTATIILNEDIFQHVLDGYAGTSDGYEIGLAKNSSIQLVSSAASSPVGCTVTISSSNDGVNWVALTPVSVTTNATSFLTMPTNYAQFIKVVKAISSGAVHIKIILSIQGDE